MDPITAMTLGMGAVSTVNSLARNDSEKQLGMQLQLMDAQAMINNRAMDRQVQAQKEMFDYTSYGHRVKQLKEAGLNPALVYGMGASGGGGVTGSIAAPQVSQGNAPNVSSETANKTAATGMLLQLAKLKSEIDVNQSIAEKNRAEVPVQEATVPKLAAETLGKEIDNKFKEIELEIKTATKFKDIEKITALADQAKVMVENDIQKLIQNKAQSEIDVSTVQTKIKTFNAELQKIVYETLVANSKNDLQKQEIQASLNEVAQKWIDKQLTVEQLKTELAKTAAITGTTLDAAEINALSHILGGILTGGAYGILSKAKK